MLLWGKLESMRKNRLWMKEFLLERDCYQRTTSPSSSSTPSAAFPHSPRQDLQEDPLRRRDPKRNRLLLPARRRANQVGDRPRRHHLRRHPGLLQRRQVLHLPGHDRGLRAYVLSRPPSARKHQEQAACAGGRRGGDRSNCGRVSHVRGAALLEVHELLWAA